MQFNYMRACMHGLQLAALGREKIEREKIALDRLYLGVSIIYTCSNRKLYFKTCLNEKYGETTRKLVIAEREVRGIIVLYT